MYLVVVCVPVTSYSTVGKLESQGNRGVHDHHYTHSPGRHLDDLYRRGGGITVETRSGLFWFTLRDFMAALIGLAYSVQIGLLRRYLSQ